MKTLINRLFLGNLLAQQIFLFVLVGACCYLISMAVLIPLVELAQMDVNLANLIASVIAIYAAYVLNGKFIFETGKFSQRKELFAFYFFSLIGLVLNVVLMYFMTSFLPISYIISKTIVTIAVAAFNFVTRKFIIFNG